MSVWSDNAVKALIVIWGEARIQEELDGATRNKTIYQKISQKLAEQGHEHDWNQCRTKIKNLKRDYRTVKDHNGETGRGRKTCRFFWELDEILGYRPASVPVHLLDTGSAQSEKEAENEGEFSLLGLFVRYFPVALLCR